MPLKSNKELSSMEKPNKKKLYKVNQTAAIKLELNEPPLNNSVKQESDFLSSNETSKLNESCNPEVKNLLEIEIGQKIQRFYSVENSQFLWRCLDCDKQFRTKQKARYHAEVHIEGYSHTCNLCGTKSRSRQSLDVHKYKVHSKKFLTIN